MNKTVLLVDDDKDEHEVFQHELHKYDSSIKLFSAYNGKEGFELLEKVSVDFVFLDINMPVMNGIEFLKVMKKNVALKYIPVIIYTASDGRSFKKMALDEGAVSYFTKPNTVEGMRKLFQNVFG